MDEIPLQTNVTADHTFNVQGAANLVVTALDPAATGALTDGLGTSLTAAIVADKPIRHNWIEVTNLSGTYDLWVVKRNRNASSTTLDPSSTRGKRIPPGWTVPFLMKESLELRICNSSGAATASAVHVQAGF